MFRHRLRKYGRPSAALLGSICLSPAGMALVITDTDIAPTANVEFSIAVDGSRTDKGRVRWDGSGSGLHDNRGNTWTTGVSGYTLDQVVLRQGPRDTGGFETAGLTMFMDILTVTDVNDAGDAGANTVTFGSVLASGAAAYPAGSNGDYIVFDIDDVALSPNSLYAYRVGWTSSNPDAREVIFKAAGGDALDNDLTAFNQAGDAINAVQGTTGVAGALNQTQFNLETYIISVPEPTTAAVFAVGIATLLSRARRCEARRRR